MSENTFINIADGIPIDIFNSFFGDPSVNPCMEIPLENSGGCFSIVNGRYIHHELPKSTEITFTLKLNKSENIDKDGQYLLDI